MASNWQIKKRLWERTSFWQAGGHRSSENIAFKMNIARDEALNGGKKESCENRKAAKKERKRGLGENLSATAWRMIFRRKVEPPADGILAMDVTALADRSSSLLHISRYGCVAHNFLLHRIHRLHATWRITCAGDIRRHRRRQA
jgi:hypothetical protein